MRIATQRPSSSSSCLYFTGTLCDVYLFIYLFGLFRVPRVELGFMHKRLILASSKYRPQPRTRVCYTFKGY